MSEEQAAPTVSSPQDVLKLARSRGFSLPGAYRRVSRENPRRERMFLGSLAFFGGFGLARSITYLIHEGIGPFHDMHVGGRHLHHMVFGIGGLLGTGYLWLPLIGTDHRSSRAASRATAVTYGLASALTLDEFALWLNLQDVYWARQGRASVDAAAVFGGVLSVGVWGAPFLRVLTRELSKLRP
jgi:hypothetical protein